MTDILLKYPVQAFLVGLVLLVGELGWFVYLITQAVTAHREWKRENSN